MFNMDEATKSVSIAVVIMAILLGSFALIGYLIPRENNPWEGIATGTGTSSNGDYIPFYLTNSIGYTIYNASFCGQISINRSLTNITDFNMAYLNLTGGSQQIGFWRHSDNWTNGTIGGANASGTICFKIPALANGTNSSTAYLYFNATGATDASDINSAFLHGDEFSGAALNTSLWELRNYSSSGCSKINLSNGAVNLYADGKVDRASNAVIQSTTLPTTNYTVSAKMTAYTMNTAWSGNCNTGGGGLNAGIVGITVGNPATSGDCYGYGACSFNGSMVMSQTSTGTALGKRYAIATSQGGSYVEGVSLGGFASYLIMNLTVNGTNAINNSASIFTNETGSYAMVNSTAITTAMLNPKNYSLFATDYSSYAGESATFDWAYARAWFPTMPTMTIGAVQANTLALNTTYGNGISAILFNATTFVSKNVSATNQSASVPLFNVTNTGGVNKTIKCNQSPAIGGVSVKCAKTYNTSAALPCNTSAPSIGNLSANTSTGVWCWADFYFPQNKTANLTINITGG
jgi:hypothetical protein